MIIRKISDVKKKIVLFQGSPRDPDTCPNMESKTFKIVEYIVSKWESIFDFVVIDLSVNQSKKSIIQPCKGCISTSGGYQCHFPCSCYKKNDIKKPDLLHDLNVYNLLKNSDGFIIVSPIHWHSLTSQVKTLFDRLVCINQTLHIDEASKLFGRKNVKDSKLTGKFSKSNKYNYLLRNHLEGKVCGFYCHGDNGANDYNGKELSSSYFDVMDDGFSNNAKNVLMPFIMQLKYSGVYSPDELIQSFYINEGVDYYSANFKFKREKEFFERADILMNNLIEYFDNLEI
jgi:multimeric flavodoxin WrbA